MIGFIGDIRFALRKYWFAPGPAIAAIVTLTLGIGANTAIFSLVDGIWLRPLAIADASHLVAIRSVAGHAAADSERLDTSSSFAEFEDLRQRVPAFADVAGVDHRGVALQTAGGVQLLMAEVVSDNYFRFMGVQAELGRIPGEAEIRGARIPLIAISHGTWKRVFGGSRAVIGQMVRVRGGSAVLQAVLPATFHGTQRFMDPQVYVPRASWVAWFPDERNSGRTYRNYDLYARLLPGARLGQAQGQLLSLSADLAANYPQANRGRSFTATWESETADTSIKLLGTLLLAIGAAVLLIACTNIANLLLAFNDSRRRELAMRVALGALRGRLVQQLLTEYTTLAVVGVTGALLLAQRLIAMVPALIPDIGLAIGPDFRIDHRVLGFAAACGALSVLLCGVWPAIAPSNASPLEAIRAQAATAGRLRMPARKVFVAAQLAVSMALLTVTGLLVKALIRIESADMGFRSSQNALLIEMTVDRPEQQKQAEFETLVSRFRALPGVNDATISRVVPFPLTGGGATQVVLSPREVPSPTAGTPVWFNQVDDAYFRVIGVPLLRGRQFGTQDRPASQRVAIVNRTLAKRLFGSEDVVGRHLRIGRSQITDAEIVGVAADGKYADIGESPQPYLYLPLTQEAWSEITLTATTVRDPGTLLLSARRLVREIDPTAIILTAETLNNHMRLATYPNRMAAWLTASMGALALVLTGIGLYGVIAFSIVRRTHEIGVRMALGAKRWAVGGAVLRDGLALAIAGVVVGTALATLAARWMTSMLYGVRPLDPLVLIAVAAILLVVAIAALAAPVRRALRIEPAVALREE